MKLRGNRQGYPFCHVNDKNMVDTGRQWSTRAFTEFLRQRFCLCGVRSGVTELYSAHSLKVGAIQLYRSLGVRDENTMEINQMSGPNVWASYCAAYNDCAPNSIPRFTNLQDCLRHARTLTEEDKMRKDHADHFEYYIYI